MQGHFRADSGVEKPKYDMWLHPRGAHTNAEQISVETEREGSKYDINRPQLTHLVIAGSAGSCYV